MNATRSRPTHTAGDLIYDAIYIAGLGGGIVAMFFLIFDVVTRGDAFFTPSLMGKVLFEGVAADAVQTVSMSAVARFTAVHLIGFGLLGVALSWISHRAQMRSRHPALVIGVVFVVLELGFWIGASLRIPGVLERIGVLPVAAANLLAAVAIGLFLSTHRTLLWFRPRRAAAADRADRG